MNHPKLIAFPVNATSCKVWCPNCGTWHTHGYDETERRRWSHRIAHCNSLDSFPDGYLIKIAPKSACDWKG